jgi:hypothetical protein
MQMQMDSFSQILYNLQQQINDMSGNHDDCKISQGEISTLGEIQKEMYIFLALNGGVDGEDENEEDGEYEDEEEEDVEEEEEEEESHVTTAIEPHTAGAHVKTAGAHMTSAATTATTATARVTSAIEPHAAESPLAAESAKQHLTPPSATTADMSELHRELDMIEKKKRNIIIFGLKESENGNTNEQGKFDRDNVTKLLDDINVRARITSTYRVGNSSRRPLIVRFQSADERNIVLSQAKGLKHLTQWKNVFLAEDLTKNQYQMEKHRETMLKDEAVKRNSDIGHNQYFWKVIGGRSDRRIIKVFTGFRGAGQNL